MSQREPTYLDDFFGPARIKRGVDLVELPKRSRLRLEGLDSTTAYDDPTNKETVVDLTALGGGGASARGIAVGAVTAGKYLCTASAAGDATKLRVATTSNLAVAGHVVGIALGNANDGETVEYAPVGHVVAISGFSAPSSGKPTPVVIDATGGPVLREAPSPNEPIGGVADGVRGFITIDPARRAAKEVDLAKFGVVYDDPSAAAANDAAIARALAALPTAGPWGGGLIVGRGRVWVTKPVVVTRRGTRISGESSIASEIRLEVAAGPGIYMGNDPTITGGADIIPLVTASFDGGKALQFHYYALLGDPSTSLQIPLDDISALKSLNGLAGFSVEIGFKYNGSGATGLGSIINNTLFVEKDGTANGAFGVTTNGTDISCHFRTSINEFFTLTTAIGDASRHIWGFHFNGTTGVITIKKDGTTVATSSAIGACTIAGRAFDRTIIGALSNLWPDRGGSIASTEGDVDFIRVSKTATPSSISAGSRGAYVNGQTLFYWSAATYDGPFQVGTCVDNTNEAIPCYIAPETVGGVIGPPNCVVERLLVTSTRGTGIRSVSCPYVIIRNCDVFGFNGVMLCNVPLFSLVQDCRAFAGNVSQADLKKGGIGFFVGYGGNGSLTKNIRTFNFNFGYVSSTYAALDGLTATGALVGACTIASNGAGFSHEIRNIESDDELNPAAARWTLGLFDVDNVHVVNMRCDGISNPGSHVTSYDASATFDDCTFFIGSPMFDGIFDVYGPDHATHMTLRNCLRTGVWSSSAEWCLSTRQPFVVEPSHGTGFTGQNFASDADMTITSNNFANRTIAIFDTGVVLTTARNVILPKFVGFERVFINATARNLTFKGSTGTGPTLAPGEIVQAFFNGTDWLKEFSSDTGAVWAPATINIGDNTSVPALQPTDTAVSGIATHEGADANFGIEQRTGDNATKAAYFSGQHASTDASGSHEYGGEAHYQSGRGKTGDGTDDGTSFHGTPHAYMAFGAYGWGSLGEDALMTGVNKTNTFTRNSTNYVDEEFQFTTSATTADQVIATINLAVDTQDVFVDIWAVKGSGASGAEGGRATVTQLLVWNGTTHLEQGTADGDVADPRGQAFAPKLHLSGGTLQVKVTPWTATDTDWRVRAYQGAF